MSVDVLAIGAHPDDADLGLGGTLLLLAAQGFTTAILDLTQGEAASRGTAEERLKEADKAARVFGDLKERYPRTAFAQQGGMLAAKLQFEKGKADDARASLGWVIEHAVEDEYRTLARLRLAGLLLDAKQHDEALKQLDAVPDGPFAALAADRRGDVLLAQGKKAEARAAYERARNLMDDKVEYRRLVDAKLTALGGSTAAAAAPAASGASR